MEQIKKNKILYVIASLKFRTGPVNILSSLINHKDKNIEYTVITLDENEGKLFNNLPVLSLSSNNKIYNKILRVFKLIGIIKKINPNLIIADGSRGTINLVGLVLFLLPNTLKPKVIFRVGAVISMMREKNGLSNFILNKLERFILGKISNFVIVPSHFVKSDLLKIARIKEKKIKVVYNPIDIKKIQLEAKKEIDHPWFNSNNGLLCFLAISNLIPLKGLDFLIDAFKDVIKADRNARLGIIGSGPLEEKLRNKVHKLGLNDYIQFFGQQENPYKFIARSYSLVHPTLFEGLGIVLLEAMACKVPIITTNSPGGIPEIIEDRVNGLLVPPANPEALANAIKFLLNNSNLRDRLRGEGFKRVQKYSSEFIVKQYEEIFQALINQKTNAK